MDETLREKLSAYARVRQFVIGRQLGTGTEGSVFAANPLGNANEVALKFHRNEDGYFREKRAYERLREKAVVRICGFNVPELIDVDDRSMVLQITIVPRPFVLDFGGARLDQKPYFSDDVWEEWRQSKLEMFEQRWPIVENVIFEFQLLGIYLMDIHPRNIAFIEEV